MSKPGTSSAPRPAPKPAPTPQPPGILHQGTVKPSGPNWGK